MDYKNKNNINSYIQFRDNTIINLHNLLIEWTLSDKKYKNSVLVSYWFDKYTNHLKNEDNFKKQKQYLKYNRGQIVFLDFGYRVCHEIGGPHYSVVLNNNDSNYNPNITVVPLKTDKGKIFNSQVRLKNGLQYSIISKLNKELDSTKKLLFDYEDATKNFKKFSDDINVLLKKNINIDEEYLNNLMQSLDNLNLNGTNIDKYINIHENQININIEELNNFIKNKIKQHINKRDKINTKINSLEKTLELAKQLNSDTIADTSQIITISKARIINPIRKTDTLYKIKLDNDSLDLINNKIKQLYTFDK